MKIATGPGRLALGVTIPAGSPVYLEPRLGPLLIFGAGAAGKSFAIKKLSTRAADSGRKVLVLVSAEYTWHRLARPRGGTAVVLRPGKPFPELDPDATFSVVSTLASFPGPRTEKVPPYALTPDTLGHALRTNAPRWLFVDNLDHFLGDEALAGYLAVLWARAQELGLHAVGTIQDYASFASYPRAQPILANSKALFLMRQERLRSATEVAHALRDHRLRTATTSETPVSPEVFLRLGVGEGFLVDSGADGEATYLHVDCTEEEMRAFESRPPQRWDRRSRRRT